MPIFKGDHLDSWLYRAERYFEIHELMEEEKIKVVMVSFVPEVVDWHRWVHNRNPFVLERN